MKDFQNFLIESLNSPYKWKWTEKTTAMMSAEFQDFKDRDFLVQIENMSMGKTFKYASIVFGPIKDKKYKLERFQKNF